jgi:hypothetical protein
VLVLIVPVEVDVVDELVHVNFSVSVKCPLAKSTTLRLASTEKDTEYSWLLVSKSFEVTLLVTVLLSGVGTGNGK